MNFITDLEPSRVSDTRDAASRVRIGNANLLGPARDGIELSDDRRAAFWFDLSGHLIIESNPINLRKSMIYVLAGAAEVTGKRIHPHYLAVQS